MCFHFGYKLLNWITYSFPMLLIAEVILHIQVMLHLEKVFNGHTTAVVSLSVDVDNAPLVHKNLPD